MTTPAAPTATVVSSSRIDLTWPTVSGAAEYDVERDGVVIATGLTTPSYSDTGLTPATQYAYRVRSAAYGAATWAEVDAMTFASKKPIIIAHRGMGGDIGPNNALSALDTAMTLGLGTDEYMIVDGGDNFVNASGTLVNSHDEITDTYLSPGGDVNTLTDANWKGTQRLRDFPLYRGTVSTEAPPYTQEWLQKIVFDMKKFTVPEDKEHTTTSRNLIRDLILSMGIQSNTMVQSFQAADLGPAKAAGIPVGLLQSAGNNLGFPAILTSVNGGKPDLVLYNPERTPGDDAWITNCINNGIRLQYGTINRRYQLDTEKTRLAALGGHLTFVVSDQPFYLARKNTPITTDRWDTQYWEHGLIPSDASAEPRVDPAGGWLRLAATTASQWCLLGGFADEAKGCWKSLEGDFQFEVSDSTSTRWMSIQWAMPDDRTFHDGTTSQMNQALALLFYQDGKMRIYNRTNSTTSTIVATTESGGAGTRSSTTATPPGNNIIRVRIENLTDAAGAFTGQARVTRLDTNQWCMTAVGAAPVRGIYMHAGKNGTGGQIARWRNVTVTY